MWVVSGARAIPASNYAAPKSIGALRNVRFLGAKRITANVCLTQSGHRASGRPLSVDDLGGVLLRINDRDYYDRISLLNFSSGNYRRFFDAE